MQRPSTPSKSGSSAEPFPDSVTLWQVDSFTDRALRGNPAAVCVLDEFPSTEWMQSVAGEMNLSETAFVVRSPGQARFQLRWFTPQVEVDLCGHATLAAVHVLYESGIVASEDQVEFETLSGTLTCRRNVDGWIQMDFPSTPVRGEVSEALMRHVAEALDAAPTAVYQSPFDLVAVIEHESDLRALRPDFHRMGQIDTRGIIATSRSETEGIDFVSRFFAPRCGINEDPVTGSAHCCLAPYWAEVLRKNTLIGFQASQRGGSVRCEVAGTRTHLAGQAVSIFRANWLAR
ncbi:MAG: PhzF family phenazine biosynthesis protein [Planctomycetota bacterium]